VLAGPSTASSLGSLAKRAQGTARRSFASGAGGAGEEVAYEGLKLHATGGWHKTVGTAMSGLMWFWVFYRLYHDYEGFLFGHVPHMEHSLHEEGEGGHAGDEEGHH
jgi:NADH dehydrogenase (ubiquinone) 1 beta subcomplex subunit 2